MEAVNACHPAGVKTSRDRADPWSPEQPRRRVATSLSVKQLPPLLLRVLLLQMAPDRSASMAGILRLLRFATVYVSSVAAREIKAWTRRGRGPEVPLKVWRLL